MNDTLGVTLVLSGILFGTPLVFAAVGEILAERSGVLNLGLEGMMLIGAVSGFWVTDHTGSAWLGLLAGAVAGALVSLVHAGLAISLRVSQIVSGLALTIFGIGFSSYIGDAGSPPLSGRQAVATIEPIVRGGIADLPIIGPVLFGHDVVVYLSWIAVAAASIYLFRTRPGLALRAVGDDPASADAAGIRVAAVRYVHVMTGGLGAGLGGAYISLALVPAWIAGITGGAGWIAIAIVIVAGWRPWRALAAAYVFGAVTRLGFTLQVVGVRVPAQVLAMMPFLLAIVALSLLSATARRRTAIGPAALGVPYVREER